MRDERSFQRLTQSEKKKIIVVAVILVIAIITLFTDFSAEIIAWTYSLGLIAVIAVFEIYLYLAYVSGRFFVSTFVTLYISGVPDKGRTYIDVDGKLIYRQVGECNGANIRFRAGAHDITVRNEYNSVTMNVDMTDELTIRINIKDSGIEISKEYREQIGTEEEIRERTKRYNRVNLYLFIMINIIAFFTVLRLLGIADII